MSNTKPTYWDITYITPTGIQGTHFAVEGDTVEEALQKTPVMLSYGTPWTPDQFQAVSGVPCANPPIPPAPVEASE
jgi:hypothetical protein